jgi:hypothetical protein
LFLLFAALLTGSIVNRGFLASTVWTYSAPARVESLARSLRAARSYVLLEDEA